jgi:hypothetical protein
MGVVYRGYDALVDRSSRTAPFDAQYAPSAETPRTRDRRRLDRQAARVVIRS